MSLFYTIQYFETYGQRFIRFDLGIQNSHVFMTGILETFPLKEEQGHR